MTEEKAAAPAAKEWGDLSEQMKLMIAALGSAGSILSGVLGYMQRWHDVRKKEEDLRLREMDDRLYESFLSSSMNALLVHGDATGRNDDENLAVATEVAEKMVRISQARRTPELRREQARALFARMTLEEIVAVLGEEHADVANLLTLVAEEAQHDPKLDSPMGTVKRVLRERDEALDLLRLWMETPFFERPEEWKKWRDELAERVRPLLRRP